MQDYSIQVLGDLAQDSLVRLAVENSIWVTVPSVLRRRAAAAAGEAGPLLVPTPQATEAAATMTNDETTSPELPESLLPDVGNERMRAAT
ncbi:hypothetical protein AB0K49_13050 [Streptomyces decoyicus]|uniref:hypothetical protein n=1 Tax=Streptomyces decoyicus TaxID=249567 RepID=UPI00345DE42E